MTEDDKKLVGELLVHASAEEALGDFALAEKLRIAAARIESLSAEVERVTKERDSLQQQLRQIRGTDQWRD